MKAPKLKSGDTVRVIAPSMSMAIFAQETKDIAEEVLESMGLKVTYGKNAYANGSFLSSSVEERLQDLHEAFTAPEVSLIFGALGGFNSHQLLEYIDYDLIRKNPKRLCGFSDITALSNAIYAKTGLITYSGPCFANLGMKKGREYIDSYFQQIMFWNENVRIQPSTQWSADKWHKDQENRTFYDNEGYWLVSPGIAAGTIIGGNIATLQLLYGTKFIPQINEDIILFIEEDECTGSEFEDAVELDRKIQHIIHQPFFKYVRGLVIGRFPKKSTIDRTTLTKILLSKKELRDLPIIANTDFGHTTPFFTFPIGGNAKLNATESSINIEISE